MSRHGPLVVGDVVRVRSAPKPQSRGTVELRGIVILDYGFDETGRDGMVVVAWGGLPGKAHCLRSDLRRVLPKRLRHKRHPHGCRSRR